MPRLEDLTAVQRQAVLNFPCFEYDGAPFVPLTMHLRGDRAFTAGDQSYRVIPSSTPVKDIIQSHNSIGFDRTGVYRDLNVTFPMDRLNELVERGIIGSLTETYYSFMGAQTNPKRILEETGVEVARLLLKEGADAVMLTPT